MADGTAWGRLSVDPSEVPELLCAAVLDRAPTVLGLCLMREQTGIAGTLRAQQLVLDQLVGNQPVDHGALESRLRAAGIATSGRRYVCVAVDPQRVESVATVADALMRHVGHGIFGLVDGLLCGVLTMPAGEQPADVSAAVQEAARAERLSRNRLCAAVSRVVGEIDTLPRAMTEARETLRLGQDLGVPGPALGVQALALERLLARHGDVDALRQFVDDQIGALERNDADKGGQLVHTLEVLIDCGGSKSARRHGGRPAAAHPPAVPLLPAGPNSPTARRESRRTRSVDDGRGCQHVFRFVRMHKVCSPLCADHFSRYPLWRTHH